MIKKQNEFNIILKAILFFWIFVSLIVSYGRWSQFETINYNYGLYQFLGTLFISSGLAIILKYKSIIGFYIFVFASFFSDVLLSIAFETSLSILQIILVELIRVFIIVIVLCIKKDGISAWAIILANNSFRKKV